MGQYYKPCSLTKTKKGVKSWMYSHKYENGLKLMEHSWIENRFVSTIETLLMEGGSWYMTPIVWAGDYADKENNSDKNLYDMCTDKKEINPDISGVPNKYKYIVNHTKKLFVDKSKVPVTDTHNGFDFRVHPLPLLTCEGNGRGGGDFRKEEPIVGTWARDIISVEDFEPMGYKELEFNLVER